jgi:hypothetical protein
LSCAGQDGAGVMLGLAAKSSDRSYRRTASGCYRARIAIAFCCAIVLYVFGHIIAGIFVDRLDLASDDRTVAIVIAVSTAVYLVLLAIPFMPAAELGVAMLVVFGAKASLPIYGSTVAALTLAYLVGRLLSARTVAAVLGHLGLGAARNFSLQLESLSSEERQSLLATLLPSRMAGSVVRLRFLVFVVLFNLPGNVVIGGGGGIALLAGMSKLFSLHAYLLTVALAVAPVPLLVYLAG